MHTLRAIRDFALNYLARQDNPQHTLDMIAIWFSVIFTAATMLYLCRRGLFHNLRIARIKVKMWNLREQPLMRAKLAAQIAIIKLGMHLHFVKPPPRLRARLLGEIDLMKHGPEGYTFSPHEVMHQPAPHEHTLPPGEEPSMPWCDPCKSYHAAPKNAAHHSALQCKATYAPPSVQAIVADNIADAYAAGAATAGLPAAELASLPGDPPPPLHSLPSLPDALNAVAAAGEAAMNNVPQMPLGAVMLMGGPGGPFVQGFKIESQTPRANDECPDPFCWNCSEGCISKRKVNWLKARLQSIISHTLVTSRN